MNSDQIVIVSGLPRSGTSMMMKMLEAGGLEIMTDNLRKADDDNPKGYYELEVVKQLDKNKDWVKDARGKVVKVISQLLTELPAEFNYKVVFMRRKMNEILASQKRMLIRRGEPTDRVDDEEIAKMFNVHLMKVQTWLENQPNMDVLYIHYNDVLTNPEQPTKQICDFLGNSLSVESMLEVVDKSLHRNRA